MRATGLALGALLFASYLGLGAAVSGRPPHGIDLTAGSFFGAATPLAAFLTNVGRFPAYASLCAIALASGLLRRRWLARSCTAVGLLIAAELTSDWFKLVFHRLRPTHWLVTHEASFSYASGHATNALVFFGFWAIAALRSRQPRALRLGLALALCTLIAGIGWSRLALGAHYPTDVIGGYLLGALVLAVSLLIVPGATRTIDRRRR